MNNATQPGVKSLGTHDAAAPEAREDAARVVELLRSLSAAQAVVGPGSQEGQEALRLWFEARSVLDGCINRLCNEYYDGRHPKHLIDPGYRGRKHRADLPPS